ncbi:hypothetical protein FRB96_006124 [Tulasnella sp. 330]|nr:hypothetical protein FRB96_006124 [Tulasnella sp. 330]
MSHGLSPQRALSPPRTPPYTSSPQFSSPIRAQSRSEVHPWDTPGSSLLGSPPLRSDFSDFTYQALNDNSQEVDPSRRLIRQGHSLSPPDPHHSRYHSLSSDFPHLSRIDSHSAENEPVPLLQDTDEEFFSKVQRIVDGTDSGSAGEERTPSPLVPGLKPSPSPPATGPSRSPLPYGHSPAYPSRLGAVGPTIPPVDRVPVAGGELERLLAQKKEMDVQRRAELDATRPDYLIRSSPAQERPGGALSDGNDYDHLGQESSLQHGNTATSPSEESTSSVQLPDVFEGFPLTLAPVSVRTTRARDAKEAEQAIAAVKALEAGRGRQRAPDRSDKGKPGIRKARRLQHSRDTSKEAISSVEKLDSAPGQSSSSWSESIARPSKPSTTPATFLPTPSTPPRTTVNASTSRSTVIVSPVKGRRIRLVRPATPSDTDIPSHSQNTAPEDRGVTSRHPSEPIIQWLNSPSPKPPPVLRKHTRRRMKSQEQRDWSSIDLRALAISIPVGSGGGKRNDDDDAREMLDMVDRNRDMKKRKRIAAFRDDSSSSSADDEGDEEVGSASLSIGRRSKSGSRASASSSSSRIKLSAGSRPSSRRRQSPLKPALVEGLGRMAIHPGDLQSPNVMSMAALENRSRSHKTMFGMVVREDGDTLMPQIDAGGPASTDLRRNNTSLHRPSSSISSLVSLNKGTPPPTEMLDRIFSQYGPRWPDFRYPWSMNEDSRRRQNKRSRTERKGLVERFLERESDSASDAESVVGSVADFDTDLMEGSLPDGAQRSWASGQDKSPVAKRLTQLFPSEAGSSGIPASLFGPSPAPVAPTDPGDARVALASRRDVRAVLYMASQRREKSEEVEGENEDEGEVHCICTGPDDGRAMVRCDGCKTWSHQSCVGISDEGELGDCWYCFRCVRGNSGDAVGSSEVVMSPVLVPAEERADGQTLIDNRRALLGSPTKFMFNSPPMSPADSLAHSSPVRGHPRTPKVRDAQKSFSSSRLLPPHTPGTWFDSQTLRTPHFPGDLTYDVESVSFDPLGTPSRGTKYGVAFMPAVSTPLGARTHHRDGMFATPKPPSQYRFPSSSATLFGPGSTASTLRDHGSPPSQHYSMSLQYTDTPVQRSRPVMQGLAPPISLGSPLSRRGKGVD